jgi:hypothetical protein
MCSPPGHCRAAHTRCHCAPCRPHTACSPTATPASPATPTAGPHGEGSWTIVRSAQQSTCADIVHRRRHRVERPAW